MAQILKFPRPYRQPPAPDDYPPLPELFDDSAWLHRQLRELLADAQAIAAVLAEREAGQ